MQWGETAVALYLWQKTEGYRTTLKYNNRRRPIESIRILIAYEHILFRDVLKALIHSSPELQLVGEADTGEDVVHLALEIQPDVILMDIKMPGLNGVEATRRIINVYPQAKILIVTMYEDDFSVCAAIRTGALGYVLKGATHMEMLQAIRAIHQGEAVFGRSIATRMASYFSHMQTPLSPQALSELSERERDVLHLVVQGYKNRDIARKLSITSKTVSNHLSNIFNKLEVADRAQAILKVKEGIW